MEGGSRNYGSQRSRTSVLSPKEGGSRNGGSQRSKTSVLSPKSHRSGTKLPEMS